MYSVRFVKAYYFSFIANEKHIFECVDNYPLNKLKQISGVNKVRSTFVIIISDCGRKERSYREHCPST